MKEIYGKLALYVMRNPRMTIVLLLLTSLLSLFGVFRIDVSTNLLKLLPQDSRATQAIQKINEEEGGVHFLNITLKGGEHRRQVAQELAKEIEAYPEVEYVLYDLSIIPDDLKKRLFMMNLPVSDLQKLHGQLQKAVALGPALSLPGVGSSVLNMGPLTKKLKSAQKAGQDICFSQFFTKKEDSSQQSLTPECGNFSQLIIRPKKTPFFPNFARPFMVKINQTIERAKIDEKGVEIVWMAGAYHSASQDIEVLISDITKTVSLSFLFVFLVISLSYREKRAMMIVFIPLTLGNLWTWGFAALMIGEVNTFTAFFSAILLGLGVDFAIHLYSRYREERTQTEDLETAVYKAWNYAGPPCGAAALTSAGGFISLYFASFAGFKQLGMVLAAGVMLCLIGILVGLPLMILWRERQKKPMKIKAPKQPSTGKPLYYQWAPFGMVLVAVLGLLCASQLHRIEFEYDISEMRHSGMAYSELSEDQRQLAQDGFSPTIVTFKTNEELRQAHDRFSTMIEQGKAPHYKGVISVYSFLPTDQSKHLAELQKIHTLLQQKTAAYLPPGIQKNLQFLRDKKPQELKPSEFPKSVRHILGSGEGRHRLLIYAAGNQWDMRNNEAFAAAIYKDLPEQEVAGEFLARAELMELIRVDAWIVALIAIVLVFLASWLHMRHLRQALSALFILLIGMSWAGLGCAIIGLKLSLVNFVGIPILIGIGVGVIIHLLHRISAEGPGRIWFALKTTGVAAVLSVLTTIFSFASLLVASNRGMHSLGEMIVIGLILVSLAAFVTIPLGWMSLWFRHHKTS